MFRRTALSLFTAAALTGSLGAAAAHAQPSGGPAGQPGKGCAVEDEHGNVTIVPIGSRVGLFHCGSDGEWHFGWLVDDVRTVKPGTHVIPPRAATTATTARAARAAR